MRVLDRIRIWAAPILTLVILGLVIALGLKTGFISRSTLVANKGWLSAMSSVVSAVAVLTTAVLAYLRFFRGRTFARRMNLTLDTVVLNAPYGGSLHTVVVHASNVGSAPVWEPRVQIEVTEFAAESHTRSYPLEATHRLAQRSKSDESLIDVLDSGETGDFMAQAMIKQEVWAVTYLVTLRSSTGEAWSTVRAVEAQGALHEQTQAISSPDRSKKRLGQAKNLG